jgi:ComF family protein
MQALQLAKDFVSLFYPEVCLVCGEGLASKEEFTCTTCLFKLPKTNFHLQPENPLRKALWGRVEADAVAAYCHYQKGNAVQELVHELKYNGKKELGYCLGKWYGYDLKQTDFFNKVDMIVPVPLHKKKLRKRGYNQSAWFAKGLAEALGKPFAEDALVRVVNTDTQTRKSRYSRWENVKDIFKANKPEMLAGKHVLLVDDIITTGATIEACTYALKDSGVSGISIASIGYTEAM